MFKTVAAFATGDGGTIVFGIDPDELTVTGLDGEDPKSSGTACTTWCTAPWSHPGRHSRRPPGGRKDDPGAPRGARTRAPYGIAADKGSRDKPEFYVRRGSSTYPAQPGELREAARSRPALTGNTGSLTPYGPW